MGCYDSNNSQHDLYAGAIGTYDEHTVPKKREGDIPAGWSLGSKEVPGHPQLLNPMVRKLKKAKNCWPVPLKI